MKNILIILSLTILYFIFGKLFNIYIPCIFHYITHLYCPGCGVTRMIIEIVHGNFYQAFRYNIIVFLLLPFIFFYLVNYIYSLLTNKTPLYKKIPNWLIIVVIIILLLFGVLRNIFPFLGPVKV